MHAKIALVGAVAAVVAAALIPVSFASPSKDGSATLGTRQSPLGRILVDGRGHALYMFEKDTHGRSSCYGACTVAWPPLIASGTLRAAPGAKASLLGRTKRRDGAWQVTYDHHPLYTFFKDTRKGQTNGEGVSAFGAEWYLASPGGAKVKEAEASSSTGSGGMGAGGYGDGYGY
jgi:predicted lipoprotein with Yx(FWY)xxD motif